MRVLIALILLVPLSCAEGIFQDAIPLSFLVKSYAISTKSETQKGLETIAVTGNNLSVGGASIVQGKTVKFSSISNIMISGCTDSDSSICVLERLIQKKKFRLSAGLSSIDVNDDKSVVQCTALVTIYQKDAQEILLVLPFSFTLVGTNEGHMYSNIVVDTKNTVFVAKPVDVSGAIDQKTINHRLGSWKKKKNESDFEWLFDTLNPQTTQEVITVFGEPIETIIDEKGKRMVYMRINADKQDWYLLEVHTDKFSKVVGNLVKGIE